MLFQLVFSYQSALAKKMNFSKNQNVNNIQLKLNMIEDLVGRNKIHANRELTVINLKWWMPAEGNLIEFNLIRECT